MKRSHGLVGLLLAVALAAGCGKRPPVHYYVLGTSRVAPATTAASATEKPGLDIGVKAFHVEPPYGGDKIVYRIGEDSPEVSFYAYHRWAVSLSRMLPGVVSGALTGAKGVRSIEPEAPGASYAAYLTGRVLSIEEVDLPDGQRVRVSIALDLRLDDGSELWSFERAGESAVSADSVEEIVETMRSVLDGLLAEGRPTLESALANRP